MSILGRIKDLISANINAMLDKAEGPREDGERIPAPVNE